MKLWQKENNNTSNLIEKFTVGKDNELDLALAEFDVVGSIAHTEMLESIGLLTKEELTAIHKELKNILSEIDPQSSNKVQFYINAFSRGSVFGKIEIDQFLQKLNIEPVKKLLYCQKTFLIIFQVLKLRQALIFTHMFNDTFAAKVIIQMECARPMVK